MRLRMRYRRRVAKFLRRHRRWYRVRVFQQLNHQKFWFRFRPIRARGAHQTAVQNCALLVVRN